MTPPASPLCSATLLLFLPFVRAFNFVHVLEILVVLVRGCDDLLVFVANFVVFEIRIALVSHAACLQARQQSKADTRRDASRRIVLLATIVVFWLAVRVSFLRSSRTECYSRRAAVIGARTARPDRTFVTLPRSTTV